MSGITAARLLTIRGKDLYLWSFQVGLEVEVEVEVVGRLSIRSKRDFCSPEQQIWPRVFLSPLFYFFDLG